MNAAVTVVLVADGCGVGAAPDAAVWASVGANTVANTAAAVGGLNLETLRSWGLGNLCDIEGVEPVDNPAAYAAKAVPRSAANETPTGHWELFGATSAAAAATYPDGFPAELVEELCDAWEVGGVLCNAAQSGLVALDEHGAEHLAGGHPIVYTSSDSVLQVAAHLDVVPAEKLWVMCEQARAICDERWPVGRVIARPFDGEPGGWRRRSDLRRDLGTPAPGRTAVDALLDAGVQVAAIGKIVDIFDRDDFVVAVKPVNLDDTFDHTHVAASQMRHSGGVVIVNVAEFDYRGHARDPRGFAATLETFDRFCARIVNELRTGDRIVVTADHGNDPTFTVDSNGDPTVDHTREHVPMLIYRHWHPGVDGGTVDMADLGPTLCRWHDVDPSGLDGAAIASNT